MTTEERLRRRQFRLGVFVLLLAIFTTAQGGYFSLENTKQTDCFDTQLAKLNDVSQIRSELVARESGAEKEWQLLLADLAEVQSDPKNADPEEVKTIREELIVALLDYAAVIKEIEKERKENPIPEYEAGQCG